MNSKKGVGHEVDWVIGIGLFLLSLVAIFVLFKPGVTPVYDSETLLNIIQDNLDKNIEWEITKVPIFIEPLEHLLAASNPPATGKIEGPQNIILEDTELEIKKDDADPSTTLMNTNNDHSDEKPHLFLTKMENLGTQDNTFAIKNLREQNMEMFYIPIVLPVPQPDGTIAYGQEFVELEEITSESVSCTNLNSISDAGVRNDLISRCGFWRCFGRSQDCLQVSEALDGTKFLMTSDNDLALPSAYFKRDSPKRKYLLLYSKDPLNFINPEPRKPNHELIGEGYVKACVVTKEDGTVPNWLDNTECKVEYSVGIKEKLNGISLHNFFSLNNLECDSAFNLGNGYECVKEKWGFPSSKEFRIDITTPPDASKKISARFPREVIPPPNINIFARQFNSFVLTDEGEKIPVQVSVKIW
ncbi:MAG TPA: hypothetical protein VJG30_04520 [Candidatus Nanoarchaeia archaeon]|nr:hypothetical protein [Candidatus Nanoarchaeia archaeon]